MKHYLYILCAVVLALPSCKQQNWMDWKVSNTAWLVQNRAKDSIQVTPTGLQYKVIRQGVMNIKPDEEKSVTIDYVGYLINGCVFDSCSNYSSSVSGFVDGFKEGLKKMQKSGHYILYIPYELGYGSDGFGSPGNKNFIPPYSTLVFDITLKDVY